MTSLATEIDNGLVHASPIPLMCCSFTRFVAARILMPREKNGPCCVKAVGTGQARFGLSIQRQRRCNSSSNHVSRTSRGSISFLPPLPSRAAAPPHPPPRPRGPHPFSPVPSPQYAQGRQSHSLGTGSYTILVPSDAKIRRARRWAARRPTEFSC